MIIDSRSPYHHTIGSLEEAALFDRYVQSRNRYKQDFITEVASRVVSGPLLDWSGGYGSLGIEVVRRRPVSFWGICTSDWSEELYRGTIRKRRLRACHLTRAPSVPLPFDAGTFEVVVSANYLHEWDRPEQLFEEAYRVLRVGGAAFINDLKRDADPYITEYVLREFGGGSSAGAEFYARTFVRSLRSAYGTDELRDVLRGCDFSSARVHSDNPMTFTVILEKEL